MSLRELLELFRKEMDIEIREVDNIFYILLEHFCGIIKLKYTLEPSRKLSDLQLKKMRYALDTLKEHTPVQHIIGHADFFDLEIKVDSNVLIPRPETEELVYWVTKDIVSPQRVLDVCTGSGCIAVALARKFLNSKIEALDISEQALEIASWNAENNGVKINFYCEDILKCERLKSSYSLIVANPPYVLKKEQGKMRPNVLVHEPYIALFVEDNTPLIFYDKIAHLAKESLEEGGQLFFEINEKFGLQTVDLLKSVGYKEVELRQDMNGKDRMIRARI